MALYVGAFDPITLGHLDIIRRSCKLFDKVIVGVVDQLDKQPLFTVEERVRQIHQVIQGFANVEVKSIDDILIEATQGQHVYVLIRGLRSVTDFEQEFQISAINKKLAVSTETVLMMAAPQYRFVSSTLVREVAAAGGCVKGLVPLAVEKALLAKFKGRVPRAIPTG
ncbi:MAG: pantetheine-phosphate adenylyltransferase [Thermanaeromonas sp.]|uniref:pantetheine-phosphate adenylyltransferase n=1 Tax=Thermanaeromonas sp. TaxID=2003697 RepID=UPI00243BE488|nr:pantetheine-phosphate adenylyltransferase [Thermanaeromonas sp.]MCG0278398.1 pantetheine-phosphate adenylyltransferase [Thermanaeromonas sp.]